MEVLDALKEIATEVKTDIVNEAMDVEAFFVNAAKYAAQNIKVAVVGAVTDAVSAAESSFAQDPSLDKFAFAFSNAVSALEKDGVAFVVADIKYATEAVIQQRNARLETAATSNTAEGQTSDDTAEKTGDEAQS